MKKTTLFLALTLCLHVHAQRSKGEKIEFNYIQYPTVRMDLTWTYAPKVVQQNKAAILEEQEAYLQNLERIKDEYLAEVEAYENYTAAEKLIAGKPRKPMLPELIYESLILDEAVVANEHIKIDGFEKALDNADFTAEIVLSGFQMESKFEKNKENAVFFYDVMYKNPVSVNIYDKDGKVYLNEVVENTTLHKETPKKDSSAELKAYWKTNESAFIQELEKTSYNSALIKGADYINDVLGYQEKSESIQINTAKGKKITYPELDRAIEIMRRALISFGDGMSPNSLDGLKEAVQIWENQLLEKDLKNKKARINEKVTAGIHWNCVLTYSILNDFDKASAHLNELKLIGRGASGTNAEKFMQNFMARKR
ncbi:hypothetical protein [Flagellimonas sp.]|uniref:hypothetical protein n=1 Tax=Flagellimonas sp. TaxID=2058762 RepID=UPI003B506B97